MNNTPKLIIICIALIFISGLIQSFIICPVEKYYFESSTAEYASWVHIPRAFNVFVLMLLGGFGIIPIFIGAFLSTFLHSADIYNNLTSSTLTSIALIASLILVNYTNHKKWHTPIITTDKTGQLFRTFILIHLISSLFNTILYNSLYASRVENLLLIFVIGDSVGGVLIVTLFLLFRNKLFKRIIKTDG